MYHGKMTEELKQLSKEYEEVMGYDPDGEMGVNFVEDEYEEYCALLRECIRKRDHLGNLVEHYGFADEW